MPQPKPTRPASKTVTCNKCGDSFACAPRRSRNGWYFYRVCPECLSEINRRNRSLREDKTGTSYDGTEPPTERYIQNASKTSPCKVCRFRDYCRERVQVLKSVACEPGNEYYEHCTVPRANGRVWEMPEFLTAQAD